MMADSSKSRPRKTVLVTGANGFIGNAVAKTFVNAGYETFGLVRRKEAMFSLIRDEIVPILATFDQPSFIPSIERFTKAFDVIVSTTEDFSNYAEHFAAVKSTLVSVASQSLANGTRPLVIFTSGCKDYGIGATGDQNPTPFTEESVLNPPPVLVPRTTLSQIILDHSDVFDAVVTRPTTLFGGSGSYYGSAFELAANAAGSSDQILKIPAPRTSIMHGTHVSDVAAAYVELAEAPRSTVAGKIYNISSWRYETAEEVANALVGEYKLKGVDFADPKKSSANDDSASERQGLDVVGLLFGFSQWIGSDKIREDIGWNDRKPLFTEALHIYRQAYEAAASEKHSNVQKIKELASTSNVSNP